MKESNRFLWIWATRAILSLSIYDESRRITHWCGAAYPEVLIAPYPGSTRSTTVSPYNTSFYSTLSILLLLFIAIVKLRASELLQVPQPWPKSVQGGALFCLSLIPLVSALHRADIIPTNLTFMRIRWTMNLWYFILLVSKYKSIISSIFSLKH